MKTELSQQHKALWFKYEPLLTRMLDPERIAKSSDEELTSYLKQVIVQLQERTEHTYTEDEQRFFLTQLLDETKGFGPIELLMQDRTIADILVNGPNEVYIERNGHLELTDIEFRDRDHAMHLLLRALGQTGRRIDTSKPYVDVILADGSRLNAVIYPIVSGGPIISIRKFQYERFSLADLQHAHFMSAEAADYLHKATAAHLNMIIIGGAGVGKTTLLNALLQEVPEKERMLVIEDTSELELKNKHAIRMQTRPPNIEGQGEVTQRDLLKNSLRMRPDRVVVGEIRGAEVLEMFQAMNIGYDGSLCTVHATNVYELPIRLTNLSALTGFDFPPDFIYRQISDCVHAVVQIDRYHDGSRRITSIHEVAGLTQGGDRVDFRKVYSHHYDSARSSYVSEFSPDQVTVLNTDRLRQYGLCS